MSKNFNYRNLEKLFLIVYFKILGGQEIMMFQKFT